MVCSLLRVERAHVDHLVFLLERQRRERPLAAGGADAKGVISTVILGQARSERQASAGTILTSSSRRWPRVRSRRRSPRYRSKKRIKFRWRSAARHSYRRAERSPTDRRCALDVDDSYISTRYPDMSLGYAAERKAISMVAQFSLPSVAFG